jgi:hypothetical protein
MAGARSVGKLYIEPSFAKGMKAQDQTFGLINLLGDVGGKVRGSDAAIDQLFQFISPDNGPGNVAQVIGKEQNDLAAGFYASAFFLLPPPFFLAPLIGCADSGNPHHYGNDEGEKQNED